MAPKGRKPKPARLKLLEGNPGKRRINPGLELPPGAPPEPDWAKLLPGRKGVAMRKVAQSEWRLVVPDLDRMGLLAHLDRGLLVQHCVREAVMDACRRSVSDQGIEIEQVVTRKDGSTFTQYVRNPALLTMAECERAINSFRAELGLGPSSRGRLSPPRPDNGDDQERAVFNT